MWVIEQGDLVQEGGREWERGEGRWGYRGRAGGHVSPFKVSRSEPLCESLVSLPMRTGVNHRDDPPHAN